MKRGIVYGIGTYFMLAAIWLLFEPATRYHVMAGDESAIWFLLGVFVIAVVAFYGATFLPPRRSWGHAWLGGALGFFGSIAAIFLLVVILGAMHEFRARPVAVSPPCTSGTDCR